MTGRMGKSFILKDRVMERFLIDGQISCSKRYVAWDSEKVRKHMEEYLLRQKRLQIRRLSIIGGLALLAMFIVILLAGCSSTKYVPVGSDVKIVEKETMVPVPVPADSATIRALLACDKNGKVVLQWFDTEKSKNAQLQFTIDSLGNMLAKMKSVPDTIYAPSKETTIEREVRIPYPVEKELTRWQKVKVELGGWAFGIIVAFTIYIIGRLIYKFKK